MDILLAITLGLLSAAAIGGFVFYIKMKANAGLGQEKKDLKLTLAGLDQDLISLTKDSEQLISKQQLESIRNRRQELVTQMTEAKSLLKELDSKLKSSQQAVKQSEVEQAKLKAVKVGDENKIAEIITTYESLNGASIALEKKLAESMLQLDTLESEVQMTEKQRESLKKISSALSGAGERMRELITEYDTINKKLIELQQNYLDLEDEYKRLVEQQLSA
jgi:chromosome segregation ATPase